MEQSDPQMNQDETHAESMPVGLNPPAGARAMAFVRWLLVAAMAVAAVSSILYSFGFLGRAAASETKTQYYCPMHPQVVQDHPGSCPICNMDLVPRKVTGDKPAPHDHENDRAAPSTPTANPPPTTSAGAQPTAPTTAPQPQGVPGLVPIDLSFDRIQRIGVLTAKAMREPLARELRTVGYVALDEARVARVHSRFSGWIEQLSVATTGEQVKQGQVLAGIYNLELVPAQQEFLIARSWSEKHPSVPATGNTVGPVDSTLEQDARGRLKLLGMSNAEIDRIAASGQPARTVAITAPISGYVLGKGAVKGLFIQPDTELFEIADLSRVWVLVDVYEYELGRVSVGQKAHVALSAYPGKNFEGTVSFLYPAVDPSTRTLRVRVELENPDLKLRPGMYGDVVLEAAAVEALIVPSEAVADTGEYQYAFVAREGGRFEPRRVTVGARADGKTEILAGLSEGDSVVTTASFLIDSESRLRAAVEGGAAVSDAHSGH
jgi:multidrug efflux pump subunit AcrA (membrane-fusion protein)